MKRNVLLFGTIAVLFTLTGAYFGVKRLEPTAPQSPAVATLFAQKMPNAAGQSHALSQWQGKTLIVNFWATWCAPCVDEMPELAELQTEVAAKNTLIIGIGIDSSANISEFAKKYHITYPLYVAGISGTELSRIFGNQAGGLPFTVLIGPDGQVKKSYLGRLKMDELRADLAAL
jgi:thiol-disulfide isomerase/thioredoxin